MRSIALSMLLGTTLLVSGCAQTGSQSGALARQTGAQLLPPGFTQGPESVDFVASAFVPPTHGVIIAHGAFLTRHATWVVVDYDAKTLSRMVTTKESDPKTEFRLTLDSRRDASLSDEEVETIRASADTVWPLRGSIGSRLVFDVTWHIYLIDGKTVRRDSGPGFPTGNGLALETTIENIASAHPQVAASVR
ncbi:hypothetical protein [Paraburkholderia sp.]|uniref:hypothetical protein n=1 Tax=Paraburkholderia sp. TaxID=1926495 RepID=UPI0023A446EF|nr:hypothetical protein [Paraburkholderia sp.]MDE1178981.1 hypothetical protein [Paraburkholderia sp.]